MDIATCEKCGAPATVELCDMREIEPVRAADGRLWAEFEVIGLHSFCDKHARPPLIVWRSGE